MLARWWARWPSLFDSGRKLAVEVMVLLVIGVTSIIVYKAITEDLTVVEPIALPKSLTDQGFTDTVIVQRLKDDFEHINSTARTRAGRASIGHDSRFAYLANIELPTSGISVRDLISLVRGLLREQDDRIGGEIIEVRPKTDKEPAEYQVRLRFDVRRDTPQRPGTGQDSRHTAVVLPPSKDLDHLIAGAAEKIVEQTNPIVLASYLYGVRRWKDLDPLLDRLRTSRKAEIGPRAQAYYGMRMIDRGFVQDGKDAIEQSLAARPSRFTKVRYGDALAALGQFEAAIKVYQEAHEIDFGKDPWTWFSRRIGRKPASALPFVSWANLLHQNGNYDGAIRILEKARKVARSDPRLLVTWGAILAHKAQENGISIDAKWHLEEQAVGKFREAILHEPRSWQAYTLWGFMLWQSGDAKGALEKLQAAIYVERSAAEAYYLMGQVLLDQHNTECAMAAFERATEVDSEFHAGFMGAAEALERLGKGKEAVERIERATHTLPRRNVLPQQWTFRIYERRYGHAASTYSNSPRSGFEFLAPAHSPADPTHHASWAPGNLGVCNRS